MKSIPQTNAVTAIFVLASFVFATGCFPSNAIAAEMTVRRNLPYSDQKDDKRRMLDLYLPAGETETRPLIVWIHGGAWAFGDKRGIHLKPQMFTDQGYAFATVNYRFVPKVTVADQATDIATAIATLHRHAAKFSIDPKKTFIMGHSAGAHLAALVCTDASYLKSQELDLKTIAGCVPVDTAAYNVPEQIKVARGIGVKMYERAFTKDVTKQKHYSPINHIAKGKNIPPFMIFYVASRKDSSKQSVTFGKALNAADVKSWLFGAEGKDHGTINRKIGKAGDDVTRNLLGFVRGQLKKK